LLFRYAKQRYKKLPGALVLNELDSSFISEFLNHLEKDRGVSARTRNQRLAAIRSFFRYISLYVPEEIALIQQVLAIPNKKYEKKIVEFLECSEIDALLEVPDLETWIGRRDLTLIMLMAQTGIRVSELTGLCCQDVMLGTGAHVRCRGKGRKERCTPLMKQMVVKLRAWLKECNCSPEDSLFPSSRGGPLSTDAVQYLLTKYAVIAQNKCSSLKQKRVSPHVLRHYAASRIIPHSDLKPH
jgi:site-specific recombinase XerD